MEQSLLVSVMLGIIIVAFLIISFGVLVKSIFAFVSAIILIRKEPYGYVYLLKPILSSDEELNVIVGDLIEEFLQIDSKARAHVWLCNQIIMSVPPLIYRVIRSALTSALPPLIR